MNQKNIMAVLYFYPFPLSTNYPSHPYNHREYNLSVDTQFIICSLSNYKYKRR